MQLKSIKLTNFRQFEKEYIEFAQGDDGKNVTIILGDNGLGKTTFAQAFMWCLYGTNSFKDKTLLSKLVTKDMAINEEAKVEVELKLVHGENDYTINRSQVYTKRSPTWIKGLPTVVNVLRKNKDGITESIPQTKVEGEIKSIIPEQLASYFFFDGERIDNMGKTIIDNKQSSDFAEAVQNILGLNGIKAALDHFDPSNGRGVLRKYDKEFDKKSNEKISQLTKEIDALKDKKNTVQEEIDALTVETESLNDRKTKLESEILQYREGADHQKKVNEIKAQILEIEHAKQIMEKNMADIFCSNLLAVSSLSLVDRTMTLLNEEDVSGKDIPYIRDETIDYLIKQERCLCGTHLSQGSKALKTITELKEFIPPKSMSATVAEFKKESRNRINNYKDIDEDMDETLGALSNQSADLIDLNDDLQALQDKLMAGDAANKVKEINAEIRFCDKTINENNETEKQKYKDIGAIEDRIKDKSRARSELSKHDEKNAIIESYLEIAQAIYDDLNKVYTEKEKEVRNKLEEAINSIFKTIYNGGLSLTIDSNYRIKVYADDYDVGGDIETSTAQSISVIFAFIAGAIKLARDNKDAEDEDAKMLNSEAYPLVMDAPLSAFDTRRIKSICETLPTICEQIIIVIKDTDGDLAEKYLGEKIGNRYELVKHNIFHTSIHERS